MKIVLLLCSVMAYSTFAQKHFHSISIATELGPGIGFVRDYTTVLQQQFEIVDCINHGYSIGYDRHAEVGQNSTLTYGITFSTTLFPQRVRFQNLPKFSNTNPGQHELFGSYHYYLSIDLPLSYRCNLVFNSDKSTISPYVGLKIRNIAYIGDEERNTTVQGTIASWENNQQVFHMSFQYEYSRYSSSVVFLPVLGIEYSHQLNNDGKIVLFCDYNYGLFNGVEWSMVGLGNTENGVSYNELDNSSQRFRVKMSHVKFGLAYRWSNKNKAVP